jgi:glycopeptide antibiotics resistance protein
LRNAVYRVLLAAWVAVLLDLTLLRFPELHPPANLRPFASIRHDWHAGGRHFWVNLVGNVVAFVPAGLFLPRARSRPTSALRVALFAAALSASIELAQYASGRRILDVDDVLLNVSGALLGYSLDGAARWIRRRTPSSG